MRAAALCLFSALGLFTGLAALAPGLAYAQDPTTLAEGRVVAVRVEGNRRVEEAAVLALVQLREGDTLAAWKLQRDIKAIFRSGFFDDIQVDISDADAMGGKIVTFVVDEKPAVREVQITGNKKIEEEDIREVLDIKPFAVLNDADVALNQSRVRDLYLDKGYFLAEVEPVVTEVGEDQVDLTFNITENRKVIVQSVDITGNEGVPDRKVRRYMQTKPGGLLPWLSSSGAFKKENLENDLYIVQSVFLEEGYVDVKVGEPKVYLSPDKRYIYITIHVEEGTRYKIGHIRSRGDEVPAEGLTAAAIDRVVAGETALQVAENPDGRGTGWLRRTLANEQPGVPLETGDYFKLTEVQATMERIGDLYRDQGYAFVNVVPLTEADPDTGVVDITFDVAKGEKYTIGRINISGNDPTFDKVIRREIPLNEGDFYSGSGLREARMRIERLGYFETTRINTPRGSGGDVLDVDIDVVERPTGSFSVGMGFSNLENFVLTGSISKNNFLGLGYLMSASLNFSQLRQQWNVSFADPYFLDSRWTLQVDGFSLQQQFIQDQYQRGGGVAIGRYLDRRDDIRLTLDYTLEDVGLTTVTAYQERLFGGELYTSGITSTLGLSLTVDKRNNRISPTQGFFFSASTELSGGFRVSDDTVLNLLGGEFNLWENRANLRIYQPIIPGKDILIFRFNSSIGSIRSTDGSVVPFIHLYRAGGINSLRGYNWFSLGPSIRNLQSEDPIHADDRLIVGGTQTWVNNIEIEAPIVKAAGISAVVFFDAGNAFGDPYGEGHINLTDLRFSYGAGIRWFSPMGPLRFELGIPINPYEDERKQVFDFSIGTFF